MRIISQNGDIDLPYEEVAVFIEYENVIARLENERHLLALYSTKEKAIKAMEMLKETYAGMPIMMQNVEVTEDEIKAIERIKKYGIMVRLVDEPSKVEYINNIIFQFPHDVEIEV